MRGREKVQVAVDVISVLILSNASALASKQCESGGNVYGHDGDIAELEQVVIELRKIRDRLEDVASGRVR